jgi:phosphoribosylformimino-5-aminoimidazole carboxamide ribotide isomerase
MATFDLLPAIDLRGGRVVRLQQGDFARETTYSDDPLAVASAFVEGGARWLHVVDLDGARGGAPVHGDVILRIIATAGERASIEVAGGLRTADAVADVLSAGAARAVIGTAALQDRTFVADLVARHSPERIAVSLDVRAGIDARAGVAVGEGWADGAAGIPVRTAIDGLADAGVRWFEVTAIDRDGTLRGPDLELLEILAADRRVNVIASGGIASVADLRAVREIGCAGAIVGRALYDGSLNLGEVLAVSSGGPFPER